MAQEQTKSVLDVFQESLSANGGAVEKAIQAMPDLLNSAVEAATLSEADVPKVKNGGDISTVIANQLSLSLAGDYDNYRRLTNPTAEHALKKAKFKPGLTFPKYAQAVYGIAVGEGNEALSAWSPLFNALDLQPELYTFAAMEEKLADSTLFQTGSPNTNLRFIIEEVFMDAIRLGINREAFWQRMIARRSSSPQQLVNVPIQLPPYAEFGLMGEATSVKDANWSMLTKTVKLQKRGFAITLTDELRNTVKIDFLAEAMAEIGQTSNAAMNMLAINCLINGDGTSIPAVAPVVGIATPNTLTYEDMLILTAEAYKHGMNYDLVVADTNAFVTINKLAEVRGYSGETKRMSLNLVNLPNFNNLNMVLHPAIPANKVLFIDTAKALAYVDWATGLLVETERVPSKETNVVYLRMKGGFYRLITEAAVVMDFATQYDPAQTNWGANAALTNTFEPAL